MSRVLLALVGAAAIAPALVVSAASAAPTCTGGVQSGSTYTCVPNGSGWVQVTVPARVDSLTVTADGGGGGKNASLGNGGSGARVSAVVPVTQGDVVKIYVGAGGGVALGGGSNVGGTGYGTGGNGGPYYGEGFGGGYGGGGGGSSAVLVNGIAYVVAGGGGGGGNSYGGSAAAEAGANGGPGVGTCAFGGGGGNPTGGGGVGSTTGTGNSYPMSTSGVAGKGGNGIYGAGGASSGGGGGGGGYGGGGGGNWNGPHGCTQAGGGGAGGSYGAVGTSPVFGSAANAGGVATSGAGGDGQVVITFTPSAATVPQAPTDLVFNAVTTDSMTAYWTPPADDGGSAVTQYEVTVNSSAPTFVGSPSIDLSGLSPSTSYTVSVKAVNAQGQSATAVSGTQPTLAPSTPPPPQTPTAAATNLNFTGVTSSAITASWTPPAPVAGWPILGYQVRVDGGTLTWTPTPSYTASGLAPGVSHAFQVYVVNGPIASPALEGTQATDAAVPDPPTGLVFSDVTSTATTLTWTPPAHDGGSTLTGYSVSVSGGTPVGVSAGTTTYTATSLDPSRWYTYSVVAQNAVGASTSDLWGAVSTAAVPGSPRMTASAAVVGAPSAIALTGFPASFTETVQVIAPDFSLSTFDVTVDGNGDGTASYTPTQAGLYTLVTAPDATTATFTATAAPAPTPTPADGPPTAPNASSNEAASGGSAQHALPSISVVGRAGRGRQAGRILVTGTTTGLAGTRVVAHVRLAGSRSYIAGGTALVDARGRFTWQRRASRAALVYFTSADGSRSNRVRIVPRRPSGR